jgi:hypothetical protein
MIAPGEQAERQPALDGGTTPAAPDGGTGP